MKSLITYILESQTEEFIGSMMSLFAALSYTAESKPEAIMKYIDMLIYVISDNCISFTIGDFAIYGKIIINDDGSVDLKFYSINPKDDFSVTVFNNYSQDEVYTILSDGTLRDLLNTKNKIGFIRSIEHYNPEEVISDDGWDLNFEKNTDLE